MSVNKGVKRVKRIKIKPSKRLLVPSHLDIESDDINHIQNQGDGIFHRLPHKSPPRCPIGCIVTYNEAESSRVLVESFFSPVFFVENEK